MKDLLDAFEQSLRLGTVAIVGQRLLLFRLARPTQSRCLHGGFRPQRVFALVESPVYFDSILIVYNSVKNLLGQCQHAQS